jgi:NB-ARC domain
VTVEEGLELIEQVLPQGQLTKVQEIVFRHSWEGQSYKQISEQFSYTLGYIKDVGSDLWKLLSDALGEKVTRRNFQVVLKQAMRQEKWGDEKMRLATSLEEHAVLPTRFRDWGEAIDVSRLYGRTPELTPLEHWIRHDYLEGETASQRCRAMAILSMGGTGKTSLSVNLAEHVQDDFDYLIWQSSRHAPSLRDLLTDMIILLSNQQEIKLPESVDCQISCLTKYLRQHRCQLVLDLLD